LAPGYVPPLLRSGTGNDWPDRPLAAIIEREGDGFVSLCPELDIASQGDTVEEARDKLIEAVQLFYATASPSEIQSRLRGEV
jgi:predicted RNase H-like HicB family nuclease